MRRETAPRTNNSTKMSAEVIATENGGDFCLWRDEIEQMDMYEPLDAADTLNPRPSQFLLKLQKIPLVEHPQESVLYLFGLVERIKKTEDKLRNVQMAVERAMGRHTGAEQDDMLAAQLGTEEMALWRWEEHRDSRPIPGEVGEINYYALLLVMVAERLYEVLNGNSEKNKILVELWVQIFDRMLNELSRMCDDGEASDNEEETSEQGKERQGKEGEDMFGVEQMSEEEKEDFWEDFLRENYSLQRVIEMIKSSGELGLRAAVSSILRALETIPGYIVTAPAARALSQIDPERSASQLLARLRAQGSDPERQRTYSRVLYLLELGRIGVSGNVVEYFDRQYELCGKKAEAINFAMRISGDGKIGLFGMDGCLVGYFELGDLRDTETRRQAQILEVTREMLFADPDTPDEIRQQFLEDYTIFYQKIFSAGRQYARLSDLTLREQVWLYAIIKDSSGPLSEDVLGIGRQFGIDGIRLFTALEQDAAAGQKVLKLANKLPDRDFALLARNYSELFALAEQESGKLAAELDLGESLEAHAAVFGGLMTRAKDIIVEAHQRIVAEGEEPRRVMADLVERLARERHEQKVASGVFRRTAGLLKDKGRGAVDLSRYYLAQTIITAQTGDRKVYLRALQARGELAPMPEIFWKVDRGPQDYTDRLGVDVAALLKRYDDEHPGKKVLLEFGPGNGRSKEERARSGIPENYVDMAMADKLYYPLKDLVMNLLDWNEIEKDIGQTLPLNDRELLVDLLYKAIMIENGQIEEDEFEYCERRIAQLTRDPEMIKNLLMETAPLIGSVGVVPSPASLRNSRGVWAYPEKIAVAGDKCTPAFLAAKALLASGEAAKYLRDADVYEALPAFPNGIMVSDFSGVDRLKDNSIDVALGVRSTVYLEGDAYQGFMLEMGKKLKEDGVYIDDSVRENFGVRYRLEELINIKKEWSRRYQKENGRLYINVVMGPGVPGEDDKNGNVPKAVVISRHSDIAGFVSKLITEGCYVLLLEETGQSALARAA